MSVTDIKLWVYTINVKQSGPYDKNAPPRNVKNGLLTGAGSVQCYWTP